MNVKTKLFLNIFAIIALSIAIAFVYKEGLAWTNPTVNPPGGSGVITASGGNVGIGTAAPAQKLDVNGGSAIRGALFVGDGTQSIIRKATANVPLYFQNAGGTAEVVINAGGNVGIGTTNPTQKLQVEGNLQAQRIKFPGVGGNSGVGGDYYSMYQEAGAWSYPYPDLVIQYHTGIKYDAYQGYGGHQFFTGYNGTGNPTGLVMQITDKVYVNDACTTPGGKCLSASGGGISGYEIKTASVASGGGWTYVTAYCSPGKKVIGGGCSTVHSAQNMDNPLSSGTGWTCGTYNSNTPSTWYAYAICAYATP